MSQALLEISDGVESLQATYDPADEERVRQLVSANWGLVVKEATKYANKGASLPDLIHEGSIGLLAAAKRFDSSLGYRFSTYAAKWIRGWIHAYVYAYDSPIRFPEYTVNQMNDLRRSRSELLKQLEREPTAEELAAHSGLTLKQVSRLMELPQVCSLEALTGEEDGTLQLLLEDLQAPQPHQELVRQELKNILEGLLSRLTQRQQQVLRLRFGMDSSGCMSFDEIGEQLGISKQRARQIGNEALSRLREMGEDLGLEDFLE